MTRREWLLSSAGALQAAGQFGFVQKCARDPRYFELSDGTPYIPIGLNLCFERYATGEAEILDRMDRRFLALAANGGNFARIWTGVAFWNPDAPRGGAIDAVRAHRLDALIQSARRHGIRLQMCLEFFRTLNEVPPPFAGANSVGRPEYHVSRGGQLKDMTEYWNSEAGRRLYLYKLDFLSRQYANEPAIFGWELWNEINAVTGTGWEAWTRDMLVELKKRFPRHLAMQSLGGFEYPRDVETYRRFMTMPGNETAQVHRYINPGAKLPVCLGPMDVLAADCVSTVQAYASDKPLLVSEIGAVEANHTAPSVLYERDKNGTLLHDAVFTPFFAGAAGPGQFWHWQDYVEKYDLWRHYGRFAKAVEGLDPRGEQLRPVMIEHPRLRIYALAGRKTWIAWCRDKASSWQTELARGAVPELLRSVEVELPQARLSRIRTYDPWLDRWTPARTRRGRVILPGFRRSIVIRADSMTAEMKGK